MGAVLFTDGWNNALAGRIPTRQNDGSTPERNHCDKTGAQNDARFFKWSVYSSRACLGKASHESCCQNNTVCFLAAVGGSVLAIPNAMPVRADLQEPLSYLISRKRLNNEYAKMRDSARDRFIGCEHNTQQQHLVWTFEFVVSTTSLKTPPSCGTCQAVSVPRR
jgi:hypothetical protein